MFETINPNRFCLECYTYSANEKCYNCGKPTFEIDDLMVPSIIELNKKGWKTNYCCSGHVYDYTNNVGGYISFNMVGRAIDELIKLANNKIIPVLFESNEPKFTVDKSILNTKRIWYDDIIELELGEMINESNRGKGKNIKNSLVIRTHNPDSYYKMEDILYDDILEKYVTYSDTSTNISSISRKNHHYAGKLDLINKENHHLQSIIRINEFASKVEPLV